MEKNYKGYAYMANSDKFSVLYGDTETDILDKLSGLNKSRTEEMKYVYCNIGAYNAEMNKYIHYQKYDVVSGQNISPMELKIPSLSKEEFQRVTREFKEKGARYNSLHKKWYISPDNKNLKYFQTYLANRQPFRETEEKLQEAKTTAQTAGHGEASENKELLEMANAVIRKDLDEMNLSHEKTKILQEMVWKDIKMNEKLSDLTKMLLEAMHLELDSENWIRFPDRQNTEQTPEETVIEEQDYVLSVPKDWQENRCTIYFKDGQSSVDIYGDQFGIHFPSVSKERVQEAASEYLQRREIQLQKEPVQEYKIGGRIDAYRPIEVMLPQHPDKSFIMGISPVQGTIQAVNPDETGVNVYAVKDEKGYLTYVSETELYPASKSEVLLRAMQDELPPEKFDVVANPKLSNAQMEEIRFAFKDGLGMEQAKQLAEPALEAWQMDIGRIGFQHGLQQQELQQLYTAQGKDWTQCRNELNGLIKVNRQNRIRELSGQGFSADLKIIKSMEQLDCLTHRKNSLQDICQAFKEGTYKDTPAGDIVNSLAREFQGQEMQRQMRVSMEPETAM